MPKLIRSLVVLLACLLSVAVFAADPPSFEEGKDYTRLATPVPPATPGKIEVLELFANLVNFRTGRLDPSIDFLML